MEVIKKYFLKNPFTTKGSAVFMLAALVFGAALPMEFADADIAGIFGAILNIGAGTFTSIPAFLFLFALQLILTMSSLLVSLAGIMLEGVMNMPLLFTQCPGAEPCFLDTAWNLMRDIVNMLLIIILVVIAFATMLKKEEFGAKKALLPLIIVAILVNFSRVIVGVAVDASTIVMQVFLNEVTGINMLTDSLSAQKDILLGQLDISSFKISDQIVAIFKTLTLIVFQLGYAFILALYAVIFLVRYVALWLLTIFSPLALAAFILPIMRKKIFEMWRNQLISWSFMGVTAAFFLWLGKLFSNSVESFKPTSPAMASAFKESTALTDFFKEIFPYIFLLIFLYITFMLALKTNAMGADMIIKTGKKWGRTAGMAAGKFAGRMTQRAAMVGARKVRARAGAAGMPMLRKIAARIPLVKQWQPGYATKRYDAASANKRQKLLRKADLLGQRNRKGQLITGDTPWGSLTKDQQDKFAGQMRSKTAKRAAAILGGGANMARKIAGAPFEALTPEEQRALWSTVTLETLRKGKRSEVEKSMKNFSDKGLDDPQTLRKTILKETNMNKRLAAQILLLQNGGAEMDSPEKIEIGKKAKALGLSSAVYAHLDPEEIGAVFGKRDTPKGSKALKNHTAMAAKAVEDELKTIENLTETATRSLMKTAANIHTKIAAIQKLANEKTLTRQDFDEFEKFVQNSAQYGKIAKRYIHFAKESLPPTDPNSITNITKRMTHRDYSEIHEELFSDPANLKKAQEFYRAAADAGIAELTKNGKLRQSFQKFITDNKGKGVIESNQAVLDYLQRSKNRPFGYKEDIP